MTAIPAPAPQRHRTRPVKSRQLRSARTTTMLPLLQKKELLKHVSIGLQAKLTPGIAETWSKPDFAVANTQLQGEFRVYSALMPRRAITPPSRLVSLLMRLARPSDDVPATCQPC